MSRASVKICPGWPAALGDPAALTYDTDFKAGAPTETGTGIVVSPQEFRAVSVKAVVADTFSVDVPDAGEFGAPGVRSTLSADRAFQENVTSPGAGRFLSEAVTNEKSGGEHCRPLAPKSSASE